MSTATESGGSAWTGWVVFAGVVLGAVGVVNVIQGLAAQFSDDVFVVGESGLLVTTDLTTWGVALITWGSIMVLAALGLFSGSGLARWFAIVVVSINLIGQFAWFPAYPLWSITAIALNIVVLFALTARWEEAMGWTR